EKTPRTGKTCCSGRAVARSAEDDVTENDPHHQGCNNRQHRPQVFQLAGGGPPVHRFGVVDGSSGRRCLWCGCGGVVLLVSVTRLVGQGSTAGHVCPTGHVCTPGHVAATRHVLTAGHVRVGLWVVAGLARARSGLLVRHVVRLPWIRGCWMCSPPHEMPQWTFQNILGHFDRLGEYCRCPNRTTPEYSTRVVVTGIVLVLVGRVLLLVVGSPRCPARFHVPRKRFAGGVWVPGGGVPPWRLAVGVFLLGPVLLRTHGLARLDA